MSVRLPALLVVAFLALAGRSLAGTMNLLENPGFETGSLAPWIAEAGAPVVTSPDGIHSGSYGLTAPFDATIRRNFPATPTSDIKEVSFYLDNAQPESAQVWAKYYYDDGTDFEFFVSSGNFDWAFDRVEAYLSPGKNLTGFSVRTASVRGPVYLDDFTIVAPEPASGLLALVAGCLAIPRRRRNVPLV